MLAWRGSTSLGLACPYIEPMKKQTSKAAVTKALKHHLTPAESKRVVKTMSVSDEMKKHEWLTLAGFFVHTLV